eukprot:m.121412 g.121412  ORF g.121412 m.121412 type:complete len:876 (+) comp14395_c0_seq1:134-2761(+)
MAEDPTLIQAFLLTFLDWEFWYKWVQVAVKLGFLLSLIQVVVGFFILAYKIYVRVHHKRKKIEADREIESLIKETLHPSSGKGARMGTKLDGPQLEKDARQPNEKEIAASLTLCEHAAHAFVSKDLNAALKYLTAASVLHPNNVDVRIRRGAIHLEKKEVEECITQCKNAINICMHYSEEDRRKLDIVKQLAEAHEFLAMSQSYKGDFGPACENFTKAAEYAEACGNKESERTCRYQAATAKELVARNISRSVVKKMDQLHEKFKLKKIERLQNQLDSMSARPNETELVGENSNSTRNERRTPDSIEMKESHGEANISLTDDETSSHSSQIDNEEPSGYDDGSSGDMRNMPRSKLYTFSKKKRDKEPSSMFIAALQLAEDIHCSIFEGNTYFGDEFDNRKMFPKEFQELLGTWVRFKHVSTQSEKTGRIVQYDFKIGRFLLRLDEVDLPTYEVVRPRDLLSLIDDDMTSFSEPLPDKELVSVTTSRADFQAADTKISDELIRSLKKRDSNAAHKLCSMLGVSGASSSQLSDLFNDIIGNKIESESEEKRRAENKGKQKKGEKLPKSEGESAISEEQNCAFSVGDRVRLHGLTQSNYNGVKGFVTAPLSNGRLPVRICGGEKKGSDIHVKPCNMEKIALRSTVRKSVENNQPIVSQSKKTQEFAEPCFEDLLQQFKDEDKAKQEKSKSETGITKSKKRKKKKKVKEPVAEENVEENKNTTPDTSHNNNPSRRNALKIRKEEFITREKQGTLTTKNVLDFEEFLQTMVKTMETEKEKIRRKYRFAEAKLKLAQNAKRTQVCAEEIATLKRREKRFNEEVTMVNAEIDWFHASTAFKTTRSQATAETEYNEDMQGYSSGENVDFETLLQEMKAESSPH